MNSKYDFYTSEKNIAMVFLHLEKQLTAVYTITFLPDGQAEYWTKRPLAFYGNSDNSNTIISLQKKDLEKKLESMIPGRTPESEFKHFLEVRKPN